MKGPGASKEFQPRNGRKMVKPDHFHNSERKSQDLWERSQGGVIIPEVDVTEHPLDSYRKPQQQYYGSRPMSVGGFVDTQESSSPKRGPNSPTHYHKSSFQPESDYYNYN